MSAKIDISPEQLDIVQAILRAHLPKGTLAWAFGSRVTWTAKPYSDLDLAVEGAAPLPLVTMGDLQEAFENSDLPWRVDVIDLKSVSPEFRAIVERQRVPADWLEVNLADVFVFSSGLSKPRSEFGSGYPFLTFKDVFYNTFVPSDLGGLVTSTDSERSNCSIKRGDVFLTRTSETFDELGMSCVALDDVPHATFNGFTKRLRPIDPKAVSPEYLGYYFKSSKFRTAVNAMATMSTRASLNNSMLAVLPLVLPPFLEQSDIAQVLKSLDDKIELNRQINQTLEALARAVFEDWFVAFGPTRRKMAGETDPAAIIGGLLPPETASPLATLFPDSFGDNGLPLGWEPKSLGDVVEPRKGRNITKKTVAHGTVPVVAGGLSPAYYHDTANVSGPVITASASGANAGFVRLYNQDIWASDCSYISREQTEYLFTIYALLSSRQDEIYSMQQGAAQPHVYPSDLKRLAIADAPPPIWQACEELLSPMFEQLAGNEQENQNLAATRDLLLPKLMSGELRLLDGEGGV